ncbi:MAG: LysR family transcriptional regulator [Methylococcales bacterium]|nr:LysR family transcriptional regulator [Methylococcales bacterium]
MGQIEDLRLYAVVIDEGSVTRAATTLNIAKSAVSRRLALLEVRYEAKLIERGPGSWKVTETGEELYRRAVRAVGEVNEIDADFLSASANLSGPLSVSVPREFGLGYLDEALMSFKIKYPEIILAVDFDDRLVDLDRENYDFAIRITGAEEIKTSANRIGTMEHLLCASPNYLDTHSTPASLDDLRNHHLLHFGTARRGTWNFISDKGKATPLEFSPYLNSNSGLFLLDATVKGLGISRLPDFIVKQAVDGEKLLQILPELKQPSWGVYLLHSDHRQMNRRMRVFFEDMKTACISMARPE